jgi:hypothetical protein
MRRFIKSSRTNIGHMYLSTLFRWYPTTACSVTVVDEKVTVVDEKVTVFLYIFLAG